MVNYIARKQKEEVLCSVANFSSQPMYQRIKEDILHQIESHALSPGDKIPTEHQLMEQYNVSRITISKALNELKNEGIVERFPNKGTFVSHTSQLPSLVSEAEVPENTEVTKALIPEVACIIPSVTDLFSLSMLNGVISAFPENDYICHIFQSHNPQIENYLLKRCLETNISGIILFPQDQPFFSNELLLMQLQKYPLVLLDRYLPRLDTSYVIADNQKAGELCLKHLYELGHQRFAFITTSGHDTFSIKYRIEGLFSAAEQLNIPESSVHIIEHFMYMEKGKSYDELIKKLLKEEKVTGFIAAESGVCAYLYDRFNALKINVPGSVSLVSFDKPLTEVKNPDFFTHINQSEYLMGKEAGTILRRRIEQNDMNVYHKVIAPMLEVHHSTGTAVL